MTTFRTIIIPTEHVQLARDMAAALDPVASVGLFEVALAENDTVTHYSSSGHVSDNFAAPLPLTVWEHNDETGWEEVSHWPGLPDVIADMCAALEPPFVVSAGTIGAAFADCDITTQEPFVAMARLGLTLWAPEEETP